MGAGADGPGGDDFKACQAEWESTYGVEFATSLTDLPEPKAPRLALISGRTADNPRLLSEAIATGSKCIYLEKPGAPTVAELQSMKEEAEAAGVEVLMGYNKNVCKYVSKTREFAAGVEGSHVTFVSNNAYENTAESLGECFERNAEGMLKVSIEQCICRNFDSRGSVSHILQCISSNRTWLFTNWLFLFHFTMLL